MDIPKLFIRADANTLMGTGHVMRCLALAQAWIRKGGEAIFLSSELPNGVKKKLRRNAIQLVELKGNGPQDLRQTLDILSHWKNRWLVVDGYQFNAAYLCTLRKEGIPILVIDDGINEKFNYDVDIILNQNLDAEFLDYPCSMGTKFLLGSKYILLRKEFLQPDIRKRGVADRACKLLVTMGGGDPDNQTLKVIQALPVFDQFELGVRVVVGASNPHLKMLKTASTKINHSIKFLHDVEDMAHLMKWADLAVSAGGSTCWELGFIGVPNLIIVIAKNQLPIAQALHRAEISVNLGWFKDVTSETLAVELLKLMMDKTRRKKMYQLGQAEIDGCGSLRVAETLLGAC